MADQQDEDEFSSADEKSYDDRRAPHPGRGDFDDDFDDYPGGSSPASKPPHTSGVISNQPFDEAVELSDDGSEQPSPAGKSGAAGSSQAAIANQPFDEAVELSSEGTVDDHNDRQAEMAGSPGYKGGDKGGYGRAAAEPRAGSSGSETSPSRQSGGMGSSVQRNFAPAAVGGRHEEEGDEGQSSMGASMGGHEHEGAAEVGEGLYNPQEYAHLGVSQEVQELFQYITRYKPHHIELETKMKPFIADYIPAVGEIDAFVKVPRPDSKPDNLGLTVLDEPAANQSDPTVFTLQLRAVTKSSGAQPMLVRSVEYAEKNPKMLTNWVNSINDLHRHKPAPSVRYSKPMPDIEALMQIWPANFEEMLENTRLPDAELAVELRDLVRLMCAILDIPVYNNITESLHVLFSLYSDFKANVHFQQQLAEQQVDEPDLTSV